MNKTPFNPYAAPQSSSDEHVSTHCYRDGRLLVVPKDGGLPPRCVKCNEPADMDKPTKFAWHHPGWYLFIPINIILYAVIAAFVQKKARITLGLCESHRRRRRKFTWASFGLFGVGVVILFAGLPEGNPWIISFGGLLILVAIVMSIVGTQVLTSSRISKDEARLKGCGPAFLDSLPHA